MDMFAFNVTVVAIGAIYCVYAHAMRFHRERLRRIRQRVALMLWAASQKAS